jgi:hypothetical protein
MNRAIAAALLSAAFGASCQETSRRPAPLAQACDDATRCVDSPPLGAGGLGGFDAGDSDAAARQRTVAGTIAWLDGDDFAAARPFVASATVRAQAAAGDFAATTYDGSAFTLDGVRVSPSTWFIAEPEGGLDALTTIGAVDTTQAADVVLRLGRPSSLDLVFGVLALPAAVDPQSAQLVVRFVDAVRRQPVPGVVVSLAQAGFTAYAEGSTWSDDAPGTSSAGLAVAGNVPALPLPGSIHEVVVSGAAAGTLEVLLAAGSLTLLDVALGS